MSRADRRDKTERKAKARRKRLLSALGVPNPAILAMMAKPEKNLGTEPQGKFRNNHIANEYASRGVAVKTNSRKGHSTYRSKLGTYGVAMNWKPHDQRQLDALDDDLNEEKNNG